MKLSDIGKITEEVTVENLLLLISCLVDRYDSGVICNVWREDFDLRQQFPILNKIIPESSDAR